MPLTDSIRNIGRNSTLLLARQINWRDHPGDAGITLVGDNNHRNIYAFRSEEITPDQTLVEVDLNKGYPGRNKPVRTQIGLTGPLNFALDETQLGELFRWITGSDNQPSGADADRAVTGGDIIAASTTVTKGTAQTPASDKQPKDLLTEPPARYASSGTRPAARCQVAQIRVTISGVSSPRRGVIKIAGVDQFDRQLEEDIAYPGSDMLSDPKLSKNFYKEISSITLVDEADVPAANALPTTGITWHVEAVPTNYKYYFALTNARTPFYAAELNYGSGDIITFTGLVANNTTVNYGELIELSVDVLGRQAHVGKNLAGETTPTDVSGSGWSRPEGNVMVDMGTELRVGDSGDDIFSSDDYLYYCTALSWALNQNYDFVETAQGARSAYRREPNYTDTPRQITTGFTVDYRRSDRFDVKSFGDDLAVAMLYSTTPKGGNHTSIELYMPRCAFSEIAVPPIPGGGPITQALNLLPYATGPGNELEIYVRTAQSKAEFF